MTPTGVPSVSVIVATRGRPENLAELVPAVLVDPSVRHLVVVVDGPDSASVALLTSLRTRFDRLVFDQIPPSGQLRALELGLTLTDADVVLLLDDDVVPTPGLASAHARLHADAQGLVLVGSMPVELPTRRADIGSVLYARDYLAHCAHIEAGECHVLDHLWLGNVSLRRSDALAVGLYSDAFTASYHADQDLGFRLAAAGLVGRYEPGLAAVHRHRRNGPAFLRDARRRGAGVAHLHLVHRHLGPFDPSVFSQDLPAPLAAVIRALGSTPAAPAVARSLLGLSSLFGFLGWRTGREVSAKVARRVMFFHGARVGEGTPAPAGLRRRRVTRPTGEAVPTGHREHAMDTAGRLAVR